MISHKKVILFVLKYNKVITGLIIFFSLLAVSLIIENKGISWIWSDRPLIGIGLIIMSLLFTYLLIESQKYKAKQAAQIIEKYTSEIDQLSNRQKEVFHLIVLGKSNKEICSTLFIEQSTLKSHINQIYKILDIKNRKEAIRLGHIIQEKNNKVFQKFQQEG